MNRHRIAFIANMVSFVSCLGLVVCLISISNENTSLKTRLELFQTDLSKAIDQTCDERLNTWYRLAFPATIPEPLIDGEISFYVRLHGWGDAPELRMIQATQGGPQITDEKGAYVDSITNSLLRSSACIRYCTCE